MNYTLPIDITQIQGTAGKMQPKIKSLMMATILDAYGYLTKFPGNVRVSEDLVTSIDGTIMMPFDPALSVTNKKLATLDKRQLVVRVGMGYIVDTKERYRDTYIATAEDLDENTKTLPFADWYILTYGGVARKDLSLVVWQGVYNSVGTSPKDIADGFLKIIADDITATNISTANANLYTLGGSATDYTSSTIGDELKNQFALLPQERQEAGVNIYIPYRYKQVYKEWFKSEYTNVPDGDVPTEYLDGTDKKAKFVWTSDMGTTKRVVMCSKENLVYGVDKGSEDFGKINVFAPNNNPYMIAATNKVVLGFQIHTVNSREFNCNNLA